MNTIKQWLWPDISSRRQVEFAILEGYWAAIIVAAISGILLIISLFDSFGPESLFQFAYIVLFALLAYGIERRSVPAALAALILFVAQTFENLFLSGRPRAVPFAVVVIIALVNAVRGTYASRKLPVPPPGTPTLQESFEAFRKVPIPTDPKSPPDSK
jgi:hypothetical protein